MGVVTGTSPAGHGRSGDLAAAVGAVLEVAEEGLDVAPA